MLATHDESRQQKMTKVQPRSLLQVVLMGFVLVLMPLGHDLARRSGALPIWGN